MKLITQRIKGSQTTFNTRKEAIGKPLTVELTNLDNGNCEYIHLSIVDEVMKQSSFDYKHFVNCVWLAHYIQRTFDIKYQAGYTIL